MLKRLFIDLKLDANSGNYPFLFFCSNILISWNTVYYHFRKWSKDGSWKKLWTKLLSLHKATLDISSVQLDGCSHTPAKRGREAVAYQHRKKSKTTNALFLMDKQDIPLLMSEPIEGNHHDLFQINIFFLKMLADLEQSKIKTNGLFLNGDAGFDSEGFRKICFTKDIIANIDFNKRNSKDTDSQPLLDDELYKERFSFERTNAWIDAFKALLVRFKTKSQNWMSLHYLA